MEPEVQSFARGITVLIKQLLCTAVLLFGASALRADTFSFTFSGAGVSGTLTLTATAVSPGVYNVTDISGTQTASGKTWTVSDSPLGGGIFTVSGSTITSATLYFSLAGPTNGQDILTIGSGTYTEVGVTGISTGQTTTVSRVPEPTTITMLLSMGIGVFVFARKLPAGKPLS